MLVSALYLEPAPNDDAIRRHTDFTGGLKLGRSTKAHCLTDSCSRNRETIW